MTFCSVEILLIDFFWTQLPNYQPNYELPPWIRISLHITNLSRYTYRAEGNFLIHPKISSPSSSTYNFASQNIEWTKISSGCSIDGIQIRFGWNTPAAVAALDLAPNKGFIFCSYFAYGWNPFSNGIKQKNWFAWQ